MFEAVVRDIVRLERRLARLEALEVSLTRGVAVYNSGAISIPDATWTALTFNSERWDDEGFHSTVANTSRLTVPEDLAGWYVIAGAIAFAGNATGTRRLAAIFLNGTTYLAINASPIPSSATAYLTIATVYYLSDSHYVELLAYQDSGGNLDVHAAGNYSPEFRMVKV